jgi:hypothetical protein
MEKKKELADQAYQLAYEYDLKYGCCPQCVLMAVQETIGYVSDDLIQAAHTLSGGGGLLGDGTCGALSGGLLALGAKFGRPVDRLGKGRFIKSFMVGKELIKKVEAEFTGACSCNDVQNICHGRTYDMWNAGEIKELKDENFVNYCANLTGKIAQWCVEMML